MKLHQEFVISRPIETVWEFFHDMPQLASCLPGAEYLGPREEGKHAGKVSSKVGPFQANFEGEAEVLYDDASKTIRMEGKGVDKKGASRGKMTMECTLDGEGPVTRVVVDSDVQLSGTIAQFGRTGLISEIANVLVADFVRNAEARMVAADASAEGGASAAEVAPAHIPAATPISGFGLLLAALRGWIRSFFRRES